MFCEAMIGFDNSAAIGTFVPLEQVGGNVQNLDFHLTIDDKEVQRGHTADMLFRVQNFTKSSEFTISGSTVGALHPNVP